MLDLNYDYKLQCLIKLTIFRRSDIYNFTMFARILISNCVTSPSALSARIRPNGLSNYLVSTLKAKPKPNVINSLKYGFVFGGKLQFLIEENW